MKNYFLLFLVLSTFTLFSCKSRNINLNCKPCDLKPEAGNCKAYIPKYYYDKTEGKCKEFIWGGCGGVVPFQTMNECLECDCK